MIALLCFRRIWAGILVVMVGLFLNVFINGLIKFYSFPSNTKNTLVPMENISFPAITICNNNKVSFSSNPFFLFLKALLESLPFVKSYIFLNNHRPTVTLSCTSRGSLHVLEIIYRNLLFFI